MRKNGQYVPDAIALAADSDLLARAGCADRAAFDELLRRYGNAVWRHAQAAAGSPLAAEASASAATGAVLGGGIANHTLLPVRAQLFHAVHAQAIGDAVQPSPLDVPLDTISTWEPDRLDDPEAFRGLPAHTRSLLWLVDAEGVDTVTALRIVGVDPALDRGLVDGVRRELRARVARAARFGVGRPECAVVVDQIVAYTEDTLAARAAARVDRHLAGCIRCSEIVLDIDDLGALLRRLTLPVPSTFVDACRCEWQNHLAAAKAQAGAARSHVRRNRRARRASAAAARSERRTPVRARRSARPQRRGERAVGRSARIPALAAARPPFRAHPASQARHVLTAAAALLFAVGVAVGSSRTGGGTIDAALYQPDRAPTATTRAPRVDGFTLSAPPAAVTDSDVIPPSITVVTPAPQVVVVPAPATAANPRSTTPAAASDSTGAGDHGTATPEPPPESAPSGATDPAAEEPQPADTPPPAEETPSGSTDTPPPDDQCQTILGVVEQCSAGSTQSGDTTTSASRSNLV